MTPEQRAAGVRAHYRLTRELLSSCVEAIACDYDLVDDAGEISQSHVQSVVNLAETVAREMLQRSSTAEVLLGKNKLPFFDTAKNRLSFGANIFDEMMPLDCDMGGIAEALWDEDTQTHQPPDPETLIPGGSYEALVDYDTGKVDIRPRKKRWWTRLRERLLG